MMPFIRACKQNLLHWRLHNVENEKMKKRKQHSKTVGQIFVRSVVSSSVFVACLNTPVFAYEFAKKVGDKRRNRDRKAPVSAMLFSLY